MRRSGWPTARCCSPTATRCWPWRRGRRSRLRIGPGTAICGTRIPPVQVAAVATLNRLAPGRVFLGIGTGNTAMRSMGQRPMRIAEFAEYLRVLSALLRGEVVDYAFNGVARPVSMLMHDFKYMNLEPRIPLYVSGFGPRAMGLAGEYGDGLVFAIPPRGVPVADGTGACASGREPGQPRHHRLPQRGADQRRGAAARRGGRFRSDQGGARPERDGQRLLLLRRGARTPQRPAAVPRAHLEAVLRAGGSDAARTSAFPHARVPLHEAASRRGGADRRAADPRHLPGRHARTS